MSQQSKRLYISGQVQGVGYRYSLTENAKRLNITGWCRNLPDGRVEAVICGQPDAVEALIAWCYQGPPSADVYHVVVLDSVEADPVDDGFQIRR